MQDKLKYLFLLIIVFTPGVAFSENVVKDEHRYKKKANIAQTTKLRLDDSSTPTTRPTRVRGGVCFPPDTQTTRIRLDDCSTPIFKLDPLQVNKAKDYFYRGIELRKEEKYEEAIELFQKAIEIDPYNSNTYVELGIALELNDELDEAITTYQQAIKLNFDNEFAYLNLGIAFRKQDKLNESVLALEEAIRLDPNYTYAYLSLGLTYEKQKNYGKAIESYKNAINIDPYYIFAYTYLGDILNEQGEFTEAILNYEKAIQLGDKNIYTYYGIGNVLSRIGQSDEAITYYKKGIELKPYDSKTYRTLNDELSELETINELVKSSQKSINSNPLSETEYVLLGYLLLTRSNNKVKTGVLDTWDQVEEKSIGLALSKFKLEDINRDINESERKEIVKILANELSKLYTEEFNDAKAAFEKAIEINHNNANYYNILGVILLIQGKFEESIQNFVKSTELEPSYFGFYTAGTILHLQGWYEEAIANYEKAIRFNPAEAEKVYLDMGDTFEAQGKIDKAILHYQKTLDLNPLNNEAYLSLGDILREQGKFEEAIAKYKEVINFYPDNMEAYLSLGDILREQGKFEEAIAKYKEVVELDSDNVKAHYSIGVALVEQDKIELAIQKFKYALELDPDNSIVKFLLKESERLLAIKLNPQLTTVDDTEYVPSVKEEPLANLLRSTPRILVSNKTQITDYGAGWVLKKEGNSAWIVTNRHVVTDDITGNIMEKIEVEFFSYLPYEKRTRFKANVVASTSSSEELDIAVLKVTGIPNDIQPLDIFTGNIPRGSATVIGHPYTDDNPWSTEFTTVKNYNPNDLTIPLSGHFANGNSGGPVFNKENQIIGMMVNINTSLDIPVSAIDDGFASVDKTMSATTGLGYAFRIDIIVEKLREWGLY